MPFSRSDDAMRVLEMTGQVDANEARWDGPYLDNPEGPSIGGRSVFEALEETFGRYSGLRNWSLVEQATVMLAHGGDESLYQGRMFAHEGDQGYSSYTPGSSPEFLIGGIELLDRLVELDGETVTLRVDDGSR